MLCLRSCRRLARVLIIAAVLLSWGCGGSSTPTPKEGLSEEERQQLRELDAQRQQEWGKKK